MDVDVVDRELVDAAGGRCVVVPTTPSSRFQLDPAGVEAAWTPATSAVMIATPSNPTGTSISFSELAAICDLAAARGAWRIVDEIYLGLADDEADGRPARTVLEHDPEAIVVSSFSKYFGMTGWRLGWAVLPEGLAQAAENLAVNFFLCASTPTQMAALACFTPEALAYIRSLGASHVWYIGLLEHATQTDYSTHGILPDHPDTVKGVAGSPVPVAPDGAFYVYFDVSGTGLSSWDFCMRALEEAHVALTPGLDFATATGSTHVRLSYAASREDLATGLERLGAFLRGLG